MLYALHAIYPPNSLVAGYQRGHEVSEQVAENWGLRVAADGDVWHEQPDGPEPLPAMPRPGPEDNRAKWEAWAVANGMSAEDAGAASQEDLEAVEPQGSDAVDTEELPRPPAKSAKKAEWVEYVAGYPGVDQQVVDWARTDTTTQADLMAWRPGDTVALAATEANQAS